MTDLAARPLRVLFVCANDFREASAKQALWFAHALAARGHAVMMSITGDANTGADEGFATATAVAIRAHRYVGPRPSRADVSAAAGFRPDIIHCWNPRLAAVSVARRYENATGAAVVVHWEDDEWRIRSDPMGRSAFRRVMRPAKRLVAQAYPRLGVTMTEGSLRWIRSTASGLDALTPALAEHVGRMVGMPCAVILPVTPAPDAASGLDADAFWPSTQIAGRPVALWTGSVHPGLEADVRAAMVAVAEVRQQGYDLVFMHVGHVLARYDLQAWATDAGLPSDAAYFVGYVPYRSVPGLLRKASILLSSGAPSDYNRLRLPSKLQAYLASGTPTITYATGFGELLHDRDEVLLTHTADPSELAGLIVEVLADPGLRATLARGGPVAAHRLFDPERNTAALLGYYRAAITGR